MMRPLLRRRRVIDIADRSLPACPKVSVCILTYNHAQFIEQAIESVLAQRVAFPYEIVIGEDCSTDTTRQIVLHYQKRYPHIIRLLLPTRNLGWRRNSTYTLLACRGDYVALLEGDDFWIDDQKLQLEVEALDTNPDAFICGARALVWKCGEETPSTITPHGDASDLATYGARELFEGAWWFRTCTKMGTSPTRSKHPVEVCQGLGRHAKANRANQFWCCLLLGSRGWSLSRTRRRYLFLAEARTDCRVGHPDSIQSDPSLRRC